MGSITIGWLGTFSSAQIQPFPSLQKQKGQYSGLDDRPKGTGRPEGLPPYCPKNRNDIIPQDWRMESHKKSGIWKYDAHAPM